LYPYVYHRVGARHDQRGGFRHCHLSAPELLLKEVNENTRHGAGMLVTVTALLLDAEVMTLSVHEMPIA